MAVVFAEERPVVLVDGRSGSGKTTLARELAEAHPDAQLVHLDEIYPGWDGLDAGSRFVVDYLLDPVRPRWQSWDWSVGGPGAWHELSLRTPLIIEGVGAISRASRSLAGLAIWVETDDAIRRERALARDGDAYRPHWDRWAAQELVFIDREHPRELADVVLDETA